MTTGASETPPASGRADADFGLRVALLALALLAYVPALIQLGFLWQSAEYVSHAYAIPLAATWLAYSRRDPILGALRAGEPGRFGLLAVAAASIAEALFLVAQVGSLAGLGVPLLLGAVGYALGGRRLLRAALPALLFLVLMVPPPAFVRDGMLIGLKALVVSMSVSLLQALGYTIAATGNLILLPRTELFVADACSGLTSLVTLAPLGAIVAYFLSHGVWRRVWIVLSVVPIAILGNALRVILTVVVVSHYGEEYADGGLHEALGFATFVLGTYLLIVQARLLR